MTFLATLPPRSTSPPLLKFPTFPTELRDWLASSDVLAFALLLNNRRSRSRSDICSSVARTTLDTARRKPVDKRESAPIITGTRHVLVETKTLAVPKGKERLRMNVTCNHERDDLDYAVHALVRARAAVKES